MDSSMPRMNRSVGDSLPWALMTLDYTEKLAAAIPDELLDTRPVDPSGHFCFTPAEIVMHCADARRMFAGQLSGETNEAGYWSGGPQADGVWQFKPHGGKAELLQSLRDTRALFAPFLELPGSELLAETAGTRASYQRNIEHLRELGRDTAPLEQAGPPNIMRVLFALTAHEAGHRGALQTLLRLHGVNLGSE
jgi:hypothetical protein